MRRTAKLTQEDLTDYDAGLVTVLDLSTRLRVPGRLVNQALREAGVIVYKRPKPVPLAADDLKDYDAGRVTVRDLCEKHGVHSPVTMADALRAAGLRVGKRGKALPPLTKWEKADYATGKITIEDLCEARGSGNPTAVCQMLKEAGLSKGQGYHGPHEIGPKQRKNREDAERLHAEGWTLLEIGKKLKVTRERVRQWLETNPRHGIERLERNFVRTAEVAERLGVIRGTVHKWAKLLGFYEGRKVLRFTPERAAEFERRYREEHERPDLSKMPPFGRWTALRFEKLERNPYRFWRCRCECGTEKLVMERYLLDGRSKSCGCGRKDLHTWIRNGR